MKKTVFCLFIAVTYEVLLTVFMKFRLLGINLFWINLIYSLSLGGAIVLAFLLVDRIKVQYFFSLLVFEILLTFCIFQHHHSIIPTRVCFTGKTEAINLQPADNLLAPVGATDQEKTGSGYNYDPIGNKPSVLLTLL